MKTVIEAFLVQIDAKRVRWQRRSLLLHPQVGAEQLNDEMANHLRGQVRPPLTPDQAVQQLVRCCQGAPADGPSCYLSHSTSWRFEPPDTVVLTYIVCLPRHWQEKEPVAHQSHPPADAVCPLWQDMFLHELQLIHGAASHAPAPHRIEARHVLSHALRHLAFLVHGSVPDVAVSRYLGAQAKQFLSGVMPALAGKLHAGADGV